MKRTLGRIAAFIMGVALMMADKWMLRGNEQELEPPAATYSLLNYLPTLTHAQARRPLLAPEMILYYIRLACSTDVVVPLIIIVSFVTPA